MALIRLACLGLWLASLCKHQSSAQQLTGDAFAEVIRVLADVGLGVRKYQEHLDGLDFRESSLDGAQQVNDVSLSIGKKALARIETVQRLQLEIERLYEKGPPSTPTFSECCSANVDEFDTRFKQRVDLNSMCSMGRGLKTGADTFLTNDVLEVMKDNAIRVPSLKWQYFANEQGVLFNYPLMSFCDDAYDPRYRPFYVELASPRPKDLVVVVDRSGSMLSTHNGRTLMDIAIDAAKTVINTLNPNDRVGVVTFSTIATTPPGNLTTGDCYSSQLAQAVPVNREYLTKGFLHHVIADGGTKYSLAFQKAFELFRNTPDMQYDNRKRDKAILFLTDGEPNDQPADIYETVKTENAKLNNAIIILTFGIGDAVREVKATEILTALAEQRFHDRIAGDVKPGEYVKVTDVEHLRSKMASYYNYFGRTGETPTVAFSVPYYDAFGLGVIMTACLPVYHARRLVGVSCVDLSMSDLFSEVTFFRKGERSYAFLIDKQARALMHPILPQPAAVTENPIFLSISALERSPEAAAMITSMTSGSAGTANFWSNHIVSRGVSADEGVMSTKVLFHYFWAPVPNTQFSVCMAIADKDRQAIVQWSTEYPKDFLYHRLDLDPSVTNLCKVFGRVATADRSSVTFTQDAFIDPFHYMSTKETLNDLNMYQVYMSGISDRNYALKEPVRDSVAATAIFDTIITKTDYVVWAYIGTRHGVFRTIPGHRMPKSYDHTLRPWYKRAVSNKGLYTFSSPYVDASGAGIVITLSQIILEGRATGHSKSDLIEGVFGMDFLVAHFYSVLLEHFPPCTRPSYRCFIVDNSGFIVVHKYFTEPPIGEQVAVENQHITQMEPVIAKDMVDSNILKKGACTNMENFRNQFSWQLYLPISTRRVVKKAYTILEIPNSNVFVVIGASSTARTKEACYCEKIPGVDGLPKCNPWQRTCECPCYKSAQHYEYCRANVLISDDGPSPCTPKSPKVALQELVSIEKWQVRQLDKCHTYGCDKKTNKIDCLGTISCSWCGAPAAEHCVETAHCAPASRPPEDTQDTTTEDKSSSPIHADDRGVNLGAVIGGVIALLVVVVACIVAVCVFKRNRKRRRTHERRLRRLDSQQSQHGVNNYENSAFDGGTPPTAPHLDVPPPYEP